MILVYDIRRDSQRRKRFLSTQDEQWQAYLRGERPVSITEGRICELFYAPYEGEHMFRLDEGKRKSAWVRLGDDSWYALGRLVKIENVIFRATHPIVTRIWIGNKDEKKAVLVD